MLPNNLVLAVPKLGQLSESESGTLPELRMVLVTTFTSMPQEVLASCKKSSLR